MSLEDKDEEEDELRIADGADGRLLVVDGS